jgi:hypothetical protein
MFRPRGRLVVDVIEVGRAEWLGVGELVMHVAGAGDDPGLVRGVNGVADRAVDPPGECP